MQDTRSGYDLETIWAANREQLRRLLRSFTRDADLMEDLLQETYIRAFKGFGGYLGGDIGAWLRKIAVNVFYTHAGKRSYTSETGLDAELPAEPKLDPGLETNLELFDLQKAISTLPSTLRDCLLMRHYYGMTSEEIAGRMGCPAGTVRWRLSTAITEIRQVLGQSSLLSSGCAYIDRTTLVDYIYATLSPSEKADVESHLALCNICLESIRHIQSIMLGLDELRSNRKVTELVDLNAEGTATVYLSARIHNESGGSLRQAMFRANRQSSLMHLAVCGKETSCEHLRDECFSWNSSDVIRGLYTAPLPEPIAPGECLELLTVFRPHSERCAHQVDDDKFRLRWTQFPALFWAAHDPRPVITYSQAIRLPKGAKLLRFHPLPVEIRSDTNTTIIWHATGLQSGPFECFVDYRPGDFA